MKKFIRQIISMASILTMLISMVPAYAAPSESTTTSDDQIAESPEVYASPEPVSDLRLISPIISYNVDGTMQREEIGSLTKSSKSLWYSDGTLAYNVITTYDNHGAVRHYRDKVEVYVYQEGQGTTGLYTLINGEREAVSGTIDRVVSSYPRPFIVVHKYTIEKKNVDPDEPYTIFTVGNIGITHQGQSTPYTRYETNLYIYWDTAGMAAAPNVSFVYDDASKKMVLSGATSAMEYRRKSDSSWTPCTDAPMYFDSAKSDVSYLVRYAASADGNPSQAQEVILPALRSAPAVTYDNSAEILSGLTEDMELKVNDGVFEDVTESSITLSETIDKIPSNSSATVAIRYKATDTQQAGAEKVITLYARSAPPSTLKFDSIALTLSGGSSSMEYKGDSDDTWRRLSTSPISLQTYAQGDREVKIYVRTRATSTSAASKPIEFIIPQLSAAPTGRIDYSREAIVELSNGEYQYSKNGTSWTSLTIENNQWDISNQISSSEKTLYLRWAATDTTPISASTVFEIPARPTAPSTPAFDYGVTGYASLTGVTAEMQYMPSTGDEWIDVVEGQEIIFDIPSSSIKYYIRIKSSDYSFASANKSLTLLKAGSAPGCSYNTTTEQITSLSNTMEMKIGDGSYTPVSETTFSTSELIDNLSVGDTLVISVRKMASQTAPASKEKTFSIYARSASPSTLTYDYASNSLSGCTSAMQYRLDDETSWRSISKSTLNLQSYASPDRDVIVYVRMKPSTTASASKSVEFTIPQMEPGPVGDIDFLSESIIGLPNGDYQYSTNKSSWTTFTVTNGVWDISSLLSTSSRTLYLRYAETATTPISNYTTFELTARPKAPTSPIFVYDDSDHPEQVVLTGVDSNMQYQIVGDTGWINITDEQLIFDVPDASVKYYIRTKSTAENWASANKSLTLSKRASAPSCTYNSSTETISGLRTTMEMSIDGAPYESVSGTTYDVSYLIDSLSGGETIEIKVRTKATSTAPASKDKIITLNSRTLEVSDFVEEVETGTGTDASDGEINLAS